jgi:hypothetical protein
MFCDRSTYVKANTRKYYEYLRSPFAQNSQNILIIDGSCLLVRLSVLHNNLCNYLPDFCELFCWELQLNLLDQFHYSRLID